MLYYNCVFKETLNLLRLLTDSKELANYRLAGGTAIALICGHRISYDLDFFTDDNIDNIAILSMFKDRFESTPDQVYDYFISGMIKNEGKLIKVDLLKYYAWIRPEVIIDDLRLASLEELAPMKLQAITNRGKRRDFYDLFILLKHFSLKRMIELYSEKFPDGNFALVLKSIEYTDDADLDDENLILFVKESWLEVKNFIKQSLQDYYQSVL